jgi:surfactin family lipopeptide synthetase A
VADLRPLPRGAREKNALNLATQDARTPFDLKQGPLFRARLITLDDAEHRLYLIAERLQVRPDPSRHLFFTVALSVAPDVPQLPLGRSMTYMDIESGGARWDLYLEMSDRAEGLIGRAQYNPDLFTTATIIQTVKDFRLLLERVAASPLTHTWTL